jgi:hypothetical protein
MMPIGPESGCASKPAERVKARALASGIGADDWQINADARTRPIAEAGRSG